MNLKKQIVFTTIGGGEHTLIFPTVGEFLAIESNKVKLSGGSYSGMVRAGTVASNVALDIIDMVSTLEVLCPKLTENLKVKGIMELSMLDMKALIKDYNDQVRTWTQEWMDVFKDPDKADEK